MAEADTNVGDDVIAYAIKELTEFERRRDAAKEVVKSCNADIKDARKRYAEYGIDLDHLDEARVIAAIGADAYREKMSGIARVLRAMRAPSASQFDLFEEQLRIPIEEKAEYEGYQASITGLTIQDCGYRPDEVGYAAWQKGFIEGQKVCAAGLDKFSMGPDEAEDDDPEDDVVGYADASEANEDWNPPADDFEPVESDPVEGVTVQ